MSNLDLYFQEDAAVVGAWPLDSGARYRVDGMVAQQIVNLSSQAATLGPGLAARGAAHAGGRLP